MFAGFANVWTPLIPGRQVKRRPVRVVLAGVPLVLFRGQDGALGALIDRCPHRAAALSAGKVNDDGCIECPFHGWQFSTRGENRHGPLNPHAKRHLLGARALPVRQYGDLVWVHTAITDAPPEPDVPDGLTADGLARIYVMRRWHCHWTRAMENMLDSPHLPFVHRRTIGRAMRQRMRPDSVLSMSWEEAPFGGRAGSSLNGQESLVFLEFFRPNIMVLNIPIPGKHLRIHALVVPEEAGWTRLIVVGSRDFARLSLLNPWFAWMNARIADEDKRVVESTGCNEVPPAAEEHSVVTDRTTLQFRKYYYQVLRPSDA